jgi:hypothetical protein
MHALQTAILYWSLRSKGRLLRIILHSTLQDIEILYRKEASTNIYMIYIEIYINKGEDGGGETRR